MNTTKRHVATIVALSVKHQDFATAGFILAEEIESIMSYKFDAEFMAAKLGEALERYNTERRLAKQRLVIRGEKIANTKYYDEA